ncbi:hypothetical protein DSO57_1018293 [Entomophthora muscae]|uniref:Uncharacterized protein n=1 Tax=Entomophthora muscae TaxID=34485 RepID=A0ACC2UDM6_9FUNG|nr:hypothetical protein DSO57_1018293 [Entomophthora muscae]
MDNNTLSLAIATGVVGIACTRLLWNSSSNHSFIEWANHLRQRKPRDQATHWVWQGAAKVTWAWQHGAWGLMVASREAVKEVLTSKRFVKLLDANGTVLDAAMGNNLLFSDGPDWKLYRHTLNPGFRSLPDASVILSTVQEMLVAIEKEEVVDIHPLLQRAAMDCIGKILLDLDLHTVSGGGEFLELFNKVMVEALDPFYLAFPWLDSPNNPLRSGIKAHLKELDSFVSGLAASNNGPAAALMRQADFTEKQIRDHAILLLLPSLTTASHATLILHHLARNPDIQEKARAEIKHVLPLTNENINQLPYMSAILKETLRICPVFAQLPARCTTEDTVIDNTHVPKGTSIVVDAFTLHRDPEYYQNPLTFNPDRVSGTAPFVGFGGGSRTCVGLNLAKFEVKIIISMLISNYSISYPTNVTPNLDPEYLPTQLLIPKGVNLVFTKITQ